MDRKFQNHINMGLKVGSSGVSQPPSSAFPPTPQCVSSAVSHQSSRTELDGASKRNQGMITRKMKEGFSRRNE